MYKIRAEKPDVLITLAKDIQELKEHLGRLERTVATLRRKVYNSPYEAREAL